MLSSAIPFIWGGGGGGGKNKKERAEHREKGDGDDDDVDKGAVLYVADQAASAVAAAVCAVVAVDERDLGVVVTNRLRPNDLSQKGETPVVVRPPGGTRRSSQLRSSSILGLLFSIRSSRISVSSQEKEKEKVCR
ncbi:hypothetical protein HYC85_014692 [Camellia sinensis]|uniref:Uncharacterized protein n=1 Tax=Camellia sinensis TaxID=4442 RepID=A0A7J7H846_CAMSI|nr:hypothetical protein HYC85_014692 [Camellia sinensis]